MLNKILFLFTIIFCNQFLLAQETDQISLKKVSIEKGFIKVWIKALSEGKPAKLNKNQIKLIESYNDQIDTLRKVYSINDSLVLKTIDVEKYSILFLLDLSKHVDSQAIGKAKNNINQILEKYNSNNNLFFLSAFNEGYIKNNVEINLNNIKNELDDLIATNKKADFNRSLIESIRFLKNKKGKKVLFVMGAGINDEKALGLYENVIPYDSLDVATHIENLEDDFVIFSVGLGDNINYGPLRSISNSYSHFSENELPQDYENILKDNTVIEYTHQARISPKNGIFKGENRNYSLLINETKSLPYSLRIGSANNQISILGSTGWGDWALWFILGLMIIIMILGVCSVLVPIIQKKNFISQHVVNYVQEGQVRLTDPVYLEPIKTGEPIVKRCQQVVPYATWEDIGGHCPNYPDCMNNKFLGCKGEGAPLEDNFFSRKGMFRQLNWMWYGALGGFLAWTLFAFLNIINFQGFKRFASLFVDPTTDSLSGLDLTDSNILELYLGSLSTNLMLGITSGAGIILMLSYIVELSDSREFSWSKIIIRTGIGAIISTLIFFLGFYLQYSGYITNAYFSGWISWLLFGVSVGIIISFQSNIETLRGVLAGLIASFFAYNLFTLTSSFFTNFEGAKLISMILLGGILGFVLVTVISRLENFELEFISPDNIQNIPISKWLQNGQTIIIGNEPGSYVFIKWDDSAVDPRHAQLVYENGAVYIQALGETLVNGKIISPKEKVVLKHKDLIQLGQESKTILRYNEKRSIK